MSFRLAESRMLSAACCRMVSLSGPTNGVDAHEISLQDRSDAARKMPYRTLNQVRSVKFATLSKRSDCSMLI